MVFCTECGNKLEEQWIICPNCGSPLKKIIEPEQKAIKPQQEIMIPHQTFNKKEVKKKRKTRKIVIIILIIWLTGSLGLLLFTFGKLQLNNLSLRNKYDDLVSVLEDPLTDPATPTLDELFNWLAIDDTDHSEWSMVWQCGDFAVMLMVRAKEMNWRMRIALMFYSYEGEKGWENSTDPYGSHGHAFNMIICQDYNYDGYEDLFYIEPQTDQVWYISSGFPFWHYQTGYTYEMSDYSNVIWTEPYYVNHYSYLG